MKPPKFDSSGSDRKTYSPFILENLLDTEWHYVRLVFSDWEWRQVKHGGETVEGYYLNGYGVEGVVKAALFVAGVDSNDAGIDFDSEGDTCLIRFADVDTAAHVAELAAGTVNDPTKLKEMITVAREQGFED